MAELDPKDNSLVENIDKQPPADQLEGDIPADDEASLFNLRTLLIALAGLVGMIALIGAIAASFAYFSPRPKAAEEVALQPPEPRLQAAPREELQALKATQQAVLSTYGWVNQEQGVARIPIEEAMQLYAQQGLTASLGSAAEGATPSAEQAPGGEGEQVFQQLGCGGCHTGADTPLAPTLVGIAGKTVELEGGQSVTADEAYLRTSILDPHSQLVAGYQPIMPPFEGRVSEEQLAALIAYIQSLGE